MKRKQAFMIFFLFIFILGISEVGNGGAEIISAATSNPKELKENMTYSYDLDGDGTKEKVKYTYVTAGDGETPLKVTLYIDGKKKFTKSVPYSYYAGYSITDFDKKDGKMDLFLVVTGDSGCIEYTAFQQYQNKKIKTISTLKSQYGYTKVYRILNITKVDGKGNFSIKVDSPVYFNEMGSYYAFVPFTMKNQKVQIKKTTTYNLTGGSQTYSYVPNGSIKVYEKADKNSKVLMTLSKKDKLNILKIKVGKLIREVYGEKIYDGYAYVKINNGKKGWIYFNNSYTDEAHRMFKEIPGWG